ncbi:MAG: hypothetical protein PVJ98_02565 [Akkermansiaceae bacterium]
MNFSGRISTFSLAGRVFVHPCAPFLVGTVIAMCATVEMSSGEVMVSDLGPQAPTDFLTGYTGGFTLFEGMSEGDEVAQTFTLEEETTLGSIIIGYRGFDDGGSFATAESGILTIRVDAGNDGVDEITETVTLDEVDFSGNRFTDTPPSFGPPSYWMNWDLSSFGLVLPAGESRFRVSMDEQSEGSDTWLFAVCFAQGNPYSGGDGWSLQTTLGAGRDMNFAITGEVTGGPPAQGPLSLAILNAVYADGSFNLTVGGLDPSKTYVLKRSLDLETFATIGVPFSPASSTEVVSDSNPTSPSAFYRIEESP